MHYVDSNHRFFGKRGIDLSINFFNVIPVSLSSDNTCVNSIEEFLSLNVVLTLTVCVFDCLCICLLILTMYLNIDEVIIIIISELKSG